MIVFWGDIRLDQYKIDIITPCAPHHTLKNQMAANTKIKT